MSEFERQQYYRRKSRISKLRRKVAHAKKRIRNFRLLLKALLIFLLLFSSYKLLNLKEWYLNPVDITNLNPEIVQVVGSLITPEYKISDIIRTQEILDEPIYMYSTKNLEIELSKLQSVKKAYIRRFSFPARFIVFIEEREPVFLIAPNDETPPISAITKDGYYIDREYMPIPENKFKTTKILSYGLYGDDYEEWDKTRVDEILKFIKKIETYSKQKVLYLDLRNKNDIYVKLEDILLRIGSFDDTTDDRIKYIPTILPEAKALKQKIKYVDLRWKNAWYIKLDKANNKINEDKNEIIETEG